MTKCPSLRTGFHSSKDIYSLDCLLSKVAIAQSEGGTQVQEEMLIGVLGRLGVHGMLFPLMILALSMGFDSVPSRISTLDSNLAHSVTDKVNS